MPDIEHTADFDKDAMRALTRALFGKTEPDTTDTTDKPDHKPTGLFATTTEGES